MEIGAGCGALTGLLCDKCKKVTAVELSKRRATAAQLRCREKDNLEVIVGNLNDIEFGEKFDYITLIGVLEYQGTYTVYSRASDNRKSNWHNRFPLIILSIPPWQKYEFSGRPAYIGSIRRRERRCGPPLRRTNILRHIYSLSQPKVFHHLLKEILFLRRRKSNFRGIEQQKAERIQVRDINQEFWQSSKVSVGEYGQQSFFIVPDSG